MSNELKVSEVIGLIIRDICELPDRTSPEDQPDAMIVTTSELQMIIEHHLGDSINLIKSQHSRIEIYESGIRKLINRKLDRFSNQVAKDQEVNLAIDELRNLIEKNNQEPIICAASKQRRVDCEK